MKRTLLILLYLSACLGAAGQYLHLTGDTARTSLSLDLDKVWNYNLYEQSRWGAGLRLTTHPNRFIFSRVDIDAYLGYGTLDERWKMGAGLSEQLGGSQGRNVLYQHAERDYAAAGSRHIADPWQGGLLLGGFMARRMSEEHLLTIGFRRHTDRLRWAAEISCGQRGRLFDDDWLIYLKDNEYVDFEGFTRLRLLMHHRCGLATQLDLLDFSTLRLLADYRHSFPLSPFRLDLYTQGGITTKNAAYVDMFDLGGTWGAPLLISNSLATARPNEFTSNAFLLMNVRLQTRKPLFDVYNHLFAVGSAPSPFVALTAAWGMMWDQDADGLRFWQGMFLQAPHLGILEPSLGVDGIIRWGAVDWGAAAIYRITPSDAGYHRIGTLNNLSIVITGKLIL